MKLARTLILIATATCPLVAHAEEPPADESALGTLVITGAENPAEKVTKLAVLPSLSPDLEDVVVRGVVRRDLELSGLFAVIPDADAPAGMYGFDDAVDVDAWRKLGAEVIVKVAARKAAGDDGKIEVSGLCYFLDVGKDPVYQKKLVVDASLARVTGHRVTDALLGAITGRPGGFASHFTYSTRWGSAFRVMTMDSDGHALEPVTDPALTAIAPAWGPAGSLFYAVSRNYAPFKLFKHAATPAPIALPMKGNVYGVAFDLPRDRMAVAVSEKEGSAIYVGKSDGSELQRVSTTPLATHPEFSPSGKLAWIGGTGKTGSQRVYLEGKAVSPAGFIAAAPTFCDTEDGVRLVYAVGVGGNHQDLVISAESGGGIARLTRDQGSNWSPACSKDGRLLAFFSTRGKGGGLYLMSLKRWRTQQVSRTVGESLRWAPLP